MGFKQQSFRSFSQLEAFMAAGHGIVKPKVNFDKEKYEDFLCSLSYYGLTDCENAIEGPNGPMVQSSLERGNTTVGDDYNPWWLDLDADATPATNIVPPSGTNPGTFNATYSATVGRAYLLGGLAHAEGLFDNLTVSVNCANVSGAGTLQAYAVYVGATFVDDSLTATLREAAFADDISNGLVKPVGNEFAKTGDGAVTDATWTFTGQRASRIIGFVFKTPTAPTGSDSFVVNVYASTLASASTEHDMKELFAQVDSSDYLSHWTAVTGTGTEIVPPRSSGKDPGYVDPGSYTIAGGRDFYVNPDRTIMSNFAKLEIAAAGTWTGNGELDVELILTGGSTVAIATGQTGDYSSTLKGDALTGVVGVRFISSVAFDGTDDITCNVVASAAGK